MSNFIQDSKDLFSNSVIELVSKIVSETKECKAKSVPSEKTKVIVDPKLKGVDGEGDEDNDKKVKQPKKPSVKEHINVTFSDEEIRHFDKVFNNTEGK